MCFESLVLFIYLYSCRLQRSLYPARKRWPAVDIWWTHHLWMSYEGESPVLAKRNAIEMVLRNIMTTNFIWQCLSPDTHSFCFTVSVCTSTKGRDMCRFHCISDVNSLNGLWNNFVPEVGCLSVWKLHNSWSSRGATGKIVVQPIQSLKIVIMHLSFCFCGKWQS